MKKRLYGVLSLVLALAFIAGCAQHTDVGTTAPPANTNVEADPPGEPTETITPTDVEDTPEPEETTVDEPIKVTELPELGTVSADSTPLLYDFLNGCLDWHVSIHRDEFDSDMFFLRHETSPEILYVDWYVVQAGYTLPPKGSAIERHILTESELVAYDKAVAKCPVSCVILEDGWELAIYGEPTYDIFNETGITFWDAADYTVGNPLPFLEDGGGWPTEWLRREPYCSLLQVEDGVDITDEWWDTWEYQAKYVLRHQDTGESLGYVLNEVPELFEVYSDEYPSGDSGPLCLDYNEMWMTLVSENLILEGAPELKYQEESYDFD